MLKKMIVTFGSFAAGGFVVFVFLLVAQTSLDDIRLKMGGLRPLPQPDVVVGGFYTVRADGRLIGPHCRIDKLALKEVFGKNDLHARITNKLGHSLPLIASWAKNVYGGAEIEDLVTHVVGREKDQSEPWNGHTVDMPSITLEKVKTTSAVAEIYTASVKLDPQCENEVLNSAKQGNCVALIFRVVTSGDAAIGYALHHDRLCFLPMAPVGAEPVNPIHIPAMPTRLTAELSRIKESIGLIDYDIVNTGPTVESVELINH